MTIDARLDFGTESWGVVMYTETTTNSLLEAVLPIVENRLKEEYEGRIKEFRKIIESEEENEEFFRSPTKYLKQRGLLSIDSFEFSGTRIPVIEDEALIDYTRELRDRLKKGEAIDWKIQQPAGTAIRDTAVYDTKTLWTHTDYWTKTKGLSIIDPGIYEKVNLGPLVTTKVNDEFRSLFHEAVFAEKTKKLNEKEALLNEKIRLMDELLSKR